MPAATLKPPDAVNLAAERVACPACGDVAADMAIVTLMDCDRCKGKGTIAVDTGRKRLSHSMLKDLLACPRRYQLDRIERLEPRERRPYLDMGAAFQVGVEHRDPNLAAAHLSANFEAVTPDDERQRMVEAATVKAACGLYLRTWPPEAEETREYEYLVRLRSPYTGAWSQTFDLHGFADGVRDMGDHLEVTENKFLGKLDGATIRSLALDRQLALEAYGLWRATGKPVTRIRYRIVRKPTIRQRKGRETKQGIRGAETTQEYIDRLVADYADPARAEHYTHQELIVRDTDDLLRIEAELWEWAEQLRSMNHRGFYPRHTHACADYGGCRFAPICLNDPDAGALFQRRPERAPLSGPEAQHRETGA